MMTFCLFKRFWSSNIVSIKMNKNKVWSKYYFQIRCSVTWFLFLFEYQDIVHFESKSVMILMFLSWLLLQPVLNDQWCVQKIMSFSMYLQKNERVFMKCYTFMSHFWVSFFSLSTQFLSSHIFFNNVLTISL